MMMMIWKKNFEKKENALIGEMSLEGSWLKNRPLKLFVISFMVRDQGRLSKRDDWRNTSKRWNVPCRFRNKNYCPSRRWGKLTLHHTLPTFLVCLSLLIIHHWPMFKISILVLDDFENVCQLRTSSRGLILNSMLMFFYSSWLVFKVMLFYIIALPSVTMFQTFSFYFCNNLGFQYIGQKP